jgi:hypothetical protein
LNSALPESDTKPSSSKVSAGLLVGGLVVFFALLGGGIAAYEYDRRNQDKAAENSA